MSHLKMLSLFSGIGGIDLAASWAGIETVAFCEIDKFCQRVLAKNWPGVTIFDDVRNVTAESLRERGINSVNIICGGFPCQDISHFGLRAGITASRSGLWGQFARLIRELRPRYIIVENVSALLKPIPRDGFLESAPIGRVLGDLAEIGHDAEWHCYPAAAFGAPHFRERVFIYGVDSHAHGSDGKTLQELFKTGADSNTGRICKEAWGVPQPPVVGVVDGLSTRVDIHRGIGNAVCPQQVYPIFEAIVAHEAARAA